MPSDSINTPSEIIGLYQEQLAQKDSQITELLSRLQEANALLTQQQRVWEIFLTSQVHAGAPTSAPRQPAAAEAPPVAMREPALESSVPNSSGVRFSETGASADTHDEAPLAADESREASETARAASEPIDMLPQSAPARIPMAYFGPPMAGFAQNLREATASSEGNLLAGVSEADRNEQARPVQEEPLDRGGVPKGKPASTVPLLPILVGICAVAAAAVLWRLFAGAGSSPRMSQQDIAAMRAAIDARSAASGMSPAPAVKPALSQRAEGVTLPAIASKPKSDTILSPITTGALDRSEPTHAAADSSANVQLVQAVARADLRGAQRLLAGGADVNARNEHSSSVLAMAARQGYSDIAELLLKRGADVNAGNDKGWTALMLAANYHHRRIMKSLLRHGARPDAVNSQGTTALMLAAHEGDPETVSALLANGASLSIKNNDGQMAIDFAAKNGQYVITDLLTKAASTPKP